MSTNSSKKCKSAFAQVFGAHLLTSYSPMHLITIGTTERTRLFKSKINTSIQASKGNTVKRSG